MAGSCLPTGNLHSPLPLSMHHRLHLWAEPLARPNPALRDADATPMEGKRIWVCISGSKIWPLPTIYLEMLGIETSACTACKSKGFKKGLGGVLKYPHPFFQDSAIPRWILQQYPPYCIFTLLVPHSFKNLQQSSSLLAENGCRHLAKVFRNI